MILADFGAEVNGLLSGLGIYDTHIVKALPAAPVTDLNAVEQVLSLKPLLTNEELDRFYRPEINEVRGEDTTVALAGKYRQAFGAVPYKTFVMGHPGVGKSTEIARLLRALADQYRGIRISVATELNPASFKIFDVLLLMMIKIAEETKARLDVGLLDSAIAQRLLDDILVYFADQKITDTRIRGLDFQAGGGVKTESFWTKILPVFASVKGEIRIAADRKQETVEYRLRRLPDLTELANRLVGFCADSLQNVEGKEWLFVLEDFDRYGISGEQLQEVFVRYGSVLRDLRANMLFVIPVWMAYSQEATQLPFSKALIPDTPVYDRFHADHRQGREAVRAVLFARVSSGIMDAGQAERLIVASGGNLRDLFFMGSSAAQYALQSEEAGRSIAERDVTRAIYTMRREYRNRLGESPHDPKPVHWEEKARKLVAVYHNEPGSDIPDPVLYSLLRARALQEFNDEGWFGVHPLVVDILKEQRRLPEDAPGGSR